MCKDAIYYNGTQLWNYYDNKVTSNSYVFEFFTYQSNTNVKLQPARFKFAIYGGSYSISVTCCNSELYRYYYDLKRVIVDKLNNHISNINSDKKYTDGFVFKGSKGNNIYTTILYNELLDSPCIRLMIGEKEKSILDTDKVYVPIVEFLSLYLTIDKAFNNYCLMSQNVTLLDYLRKFEEKIDTNFSNVNSIISNINIKSNDCKLIEKEPIEELNISNINIDDVKNELEQKVENIKETIDNKKDLEIVKSDFDDFLDKNVDKMELDLPNSKENVNTQKDIVLENSFQKKVLKNNFKNLEVIITNCVNSNVPLDSFVNTVFETSGMDLYSGISDNDKYCLNYIVSQNVKYNVNNYITSKKTFPKSINPIIVSDNDKLQIQNKIDTMYFLIMSYIYISKIKNDLSVGVSDEQKNKNFFSYCLKTITSPFVFSHILDIDKNILINGVIKLYKDNKYNGFFDEYNNEIYKNNSIKVEIADEYIKDQVEKIYDNVQKLKDKLIVSNFFNNKFMKLEYVDFNELDKYDVEVIKKILLIEGYYWNNKIKLVYNEILKSTQGITLNILEKYGIKEQKFDNTILVKYIKSKFPEFKDVEQIKKINNNVYDIIDNIDLKNYPLDVLKALYFWDINKLPKNIVYDDFVKIVTESNLDINEIISLLYNNEYKQDDTFYNSLINIDYE